MSDEPGAYAYMLRCADGSYYVGSARRGLDQRIGEHNANTYGGDTSTRRPVSLVWAQHFLLITDAIDVERQIKGWSRAKKEALISGDYDAIKLLARRGKRRSPPPPHPEEPRVARHPEGWDQARCALPPFETLAALAPQGEVEGCGADLGSFLHRSS